MSIDETPKNRNPLTLAEEGLNRFLYKLSSWSLMRIIVIGPDSQVASDAFRRPPF